MYEELYKLVKSDYHWNTFFLGLTLVILMVLNEPGSFRYNLFGTYFLILLIDTYGTHRSIKRIKTEHELKEQLDKAQAELDNIKDNNA